MTFSRHYAKARKAELKQKSGQAQRLVESVAPAIQAKRFLKPLLLLLVIVVLAAGWLFRHELTVPIRHINVEGQVLRVDPVALQAVLSHATEHSMFANAQPLRQQLMALAWVKQVTIKRQWPNTLVVTIFEVEPMARFNDHWLLTKDGTVVLPPSLLPFDGLPLLTGPPDKALFLWQAYCVMSDLLNPLALKIWQIALSPRFSYEVILNNGLRLYLGESQVTERLQLFAKVYKQQLAAKIGQMDYIDLRYASSMAIGWKSSVTTNGSPAAKL